MLALADRAFMALAWVAGALAVVMMATTFSDVIMRYFFNKPIFGAFEITEISMGLIVFFALPMMIRARENITVTVLFDNFPAPIRRVMVVLTDLTGAAVCGLIAWRMWLYGERLLRFREVTMELAVPRGLIAQIMAALMAVAAFAFILCAWQALRRGIAPLGNRDSV
jgi:TRAP-type C4-dicarboxylate transport system permease small subunit